MWIVGGILLAAGVNGLLPVTYTWQMPLWMSIALIVVGGLLFFTSSSLPKASRARRQQPEHSDES